MYNPFSHRHLICVIISIVCVCSPLRSQQSLYSSRSLDPAASLDEGLYHFVLAGLDPYKSMKGVEELDRQKVISLLHTRYPELTYNLERTPKQTLSGSEISSLFVQILKEETATEVADADDSFWKIVSSTDMPKGEEATFKFLYGYELFKQKRFTEADKIFDKIIKERKGEYEYAFYYSGLIALLEQDYKGAQGKLKKIGNDKNLRLQTPYYLAAAHYGNKDYHNVIKYYEPRITDLDLHNIDGLTQIVAYAQYKTNDYQGTIASLNRLKNSRLLSPEENYLLGIAYQKSGDKEASSSYLSDVASIENNLSSKAAFEHAINLAEEGKNGAALSAFEELLKTGAFDKNEILWNLAILNGRLQNYDKLAYHATPLLDTPKKDQATALLSQVLDNVDNDQVYDQIISALNQNLNDKSLIKSSVYNKAITALQSNQKAKAKKYFDQLADIDPLIEERGTVAAWRGIMAYEDKEYSKAIRLLTNYQTSRPKDQATTTLDFDASYFLGYSHFKMKDHASALGHFGQAYEVLNKKGESLNISKSKSKKDDLLLRLGDSYFLLDEYKSAHRAYTKVIDNHSSYKDYALWQNAIIAELENRPYDQILILDEIISDYASSKYYNRARFSTANTLFALNKYDKAAEYYRDLMRSGAPLAMQEESTIQLGLISVNAGTYDQAEQHFKQLIAQSDNPEIVQRSHLALKEIYADYTYDTDAYLDLIATSRPEEKESKEVVQALYDLAQNNYDKGQVNEAITQWSRLTEDYKTSLLRHKAYYQLAKAYESKELYPDALSSYIAAAKNAPSTSPLILSSYDKAGSLSFGIIKDYEEYLSILAAKRVAYPELEFSTIEKYQEALAHVKVNQLGKSIDAGMDVMEIQGLRLSKKKELIYAWTTSLVKEKKWQDITTLYSKQPIAHIISKDPKLIYQRSLAYFNGNDLDTAMTSITDHYDALLEEPAWLAKGLILISDIYVLKDNKDDASAALEALISSDANIPPTLKKVAKERLKALKLQN